MWHKLQIIRCKDIHPNGYFKKGDLIRIIDIRKSSCKCPGVEFLFEMENKIEARIFHCSICGSPQTNIPVKELWFNEFYFENRRKKSHISIPKKEVITQKTESTYKNIDSIKSGVTIWMLKHLTLLKNSDFNNVIDRLGCSNNDFQINEKEANKLKVYYRENYQNLLSNNNSNKKGEIYFSNKRKPYVLIPSGGKNK
jgi:hypothetical protein